MIFKTITSSVDETRKTLALFNKDWNTYKRNWQNANGVFGKIGSVFTPANAITKSDIEAIKAYNSQIDSCVTSQTAFNRTMLNASPAAQNLVTSYNGGKVSAQGMATAQNAAKASTIGLTIAQTALNAAIGMGIGLFISLVVKGIDKLVHANEEAIEKAEELRRKYEEFKSTNESNVTTLKGLEKEFEELSKGVSQYGDNISLTTEQYERYKEIIQQIVGMSPSLAEGYSTENGYIADKNGLLERAIELQEQEYRNELRKITNLDNLRTSMSGYIAEYKEAFNGGLVTDDMSATATREFTELKNAIYEIFNTNNRSDFSSEDMIRQIMSSIGIEDIEAEMAKYYNEYGYFQSQDFWKEYADIIAKNIEVITNSLSSDIVGLDDTVFDQNTEKVDSAAQSYLDMKDAISMANESIQRDLGYIAEYADGYSNLSTEQQKFVNEFLKGYDISDIMSESNNPFDQGWKFDEDKMASVKSQITKFVEALSQDETTKSALADLYAIPTDEQSISEFVEQFRNALEIIKTYCQENGIEIPIAITDSEQTINDLEAQYQRAVDFAKDKFDGYDPTAFFKEHSINTQEEIDAWQKIAQGARDAVEAEKEYIQSSTLNKNPISISTQLTNSTESLDKFQSSVKSAADAYTTLLSGNYSSTDLLDSIQAINKAASDMGESLDWEEIGSLDDLSAKIEDISRSYAESVLSGTGIEDSKFGQMLANIVQEAYKSEAALSSLNKQIDSLQSAYSSLTDIISTYNETGYITFDQLQTLLAMEPQYLSCLIDENGQLQLNQEAMQALANQRLNDARSQIISQAITELNELAYRNEQTAIEDNRIALTDNMETVTTYEERLLDLIPTIGLATDEFIGLSNAINGAMSNGASEDQIDEVFENAEKKWKFVDEAVKNAGNASFFDNLMGGSGSGSSSKSEFSETIDFFERRVEVLDNALSHLKSSMDNVAGSSAKNNLVDAELGITGEKFKNYSDAVAMYTQKADKALSKLPADIAAKVKDGAVALTDFIGDGNKDVVEAIKDYESWADKVSDCKQELAELQKEIRQLELDKFNNIMDDFNNQFDLRGDSKDLISKQIDLLKEAGQLIGESFYKAQIDQSKKQLELLETEKAQLVSQMSSAISSGRIQKGTDEWLEMVNALSDVDSNILDCKKSIEEFDNSILELHTEIFDRIQKQFSDLDSEISNLIDLFNDFEVSDEKGIWTKEAITQMGLMAQQYELAQYQVQQYNAEIDELNSQYLAGRYSASEYADRLSELSSSQWDAVKASESAKDAILELNETRVENEITGIEKEIDAYKELTDAQIDALKAAKDLHDYENSIAEKTKSITDLERQIAAMLNDNSAATVAKRKKLEEQLAEAKKDLEEAEYEHSIEVQEDALNKQFEEYEATRNKEIEALRESLNDRETILSASFETVKTNASIVGQEIATIATQHGITVSNTLISSWQSGENAIASYGDVLSQGTSAFIRNIIGVENEVWNLQAQANTTADTLAWMFATKADNLVNELTASYYAEENLFNMTNALQQSLINTLEGGYDISSIVNSLDRISSAARDTKAAIDDLANTPSVDVNKVGSSGVPTLNERSVSKDINFQHYASGTRSSQGNLIVTDEEGYEMKLPKLSSGQYTIANEGTQILTKEQTDNVFEWSKLDPEEYVPVDPQKLLPIDPQKFLQFQQSVLGMTPNMFDNFDFPKSVVENKAVSAPITIHYDSMYTFNGDVNDIKHLTQQMRAISDESAVKAAEKSIRKLSEGIRW